jgi:D-alanine-D-alanine ligase
MEVNTVPGMSKESIVPQQVRAFGLTVSDFYTKLIDDAILRSNR